MRETDYGAALRGRCPHCGKGEMFKGWAATHDVCPRCGARFERWVGSWTGATVGGYGVGAAAAALTIGLLVATDSFGPNSELLVAAIAVIAVLASYRHVKALWIAAMHSMGYVYPDP